MNPLIGTREIEGGEVQAEKTKKIIEDKAEVRKSIKPWTCAKVDFRILPPEKGTKHRGVNLQRLKRIASEGICCTPYVEAKWAENKSSVALLDTGAQWSLLAEQELTEGERQELTEAPGVEGRGVSGERIPVLGEVWRDVWIGDVYFPKQRFIAVKTMVCRVILGIDLLSRAESVSFNFNESKITLNDCDIRLHQHPSEISKNKERVGQVVTVETKQEYIVPRNSIAYVQCLAEGLEKGFEYVVEPITTEDSLISTPYGLIEGASEISLRVANLGEDDIRIAQGQTVAVAHKEEWVRNVRTDDGMKGKSKTNGKDLDFESMVSPTLENNKKKHLMEILRKYGDVFYQGGILPIVKVGVEHTIEVNENEAPSVFRPRRLSREAENEVKEHLDDLFKKGVIRPSNSKWAAPIVCVRKSDGSLRMAVDYRVLNSKSSTATLHPIPLIDDLLDRLSNAKFFAVLDAKSGYHQMPLKVGDSEKTGFVVPWGHFEYTERTPFGLKGAGYSFQRMMSVILGSSNFSEALCYLDDVLVWGETWDIFVKRLRKVLEKIRGAGLALGVGKCSFGMNEVSYLGCTIKEGMVKISEQRVAQIRQIKRPENVRGLRSAIGAFSYVQRWIPGLAEIAKPLYDALTNKPYARLKWSLEMEKAFEAIKKMIADAVGLFLPQMDKKFTLVTDASQNATGAMLAQEVEGKLRPVAFYHHTLNRAEQGYSATERELLAIVVAVKKYRVYLGKHFDLITDHQALRWLRSLDPDNETGRRGRWLDFLQQFDMNVIQKKGRSPEMKIADYLSRVQQMNHGEENLKLISAVTGDKEESDQMLVDKEEILEAQKKDPRISQVREAIATGQNLNPGGSEADSWRIPSITTDTEVIELWKLKERLNLDRDGLLRLTFNGGKRSTGHPYGRMIRNRIIVPKTYKGKIMTLVHSSASAAHMGMRRTWQRARNNFWWPKMKQELEEFVGSCEECGRNKHMNHPNVAPAAKTSIPGQPLEELMIDFVGPFQQAQSHNFQYLLQLQDTFSRYLVFVPTVDAKARTAVDAMEGRWLSLFGMPENLRSDRGRHFVAEVFKDLCTRMGIHQKLGSPEHPQSQAQVERQNQLVNQLRCLCENDIENWPKAIERVQFSHNSAINATTGFSPARILLGKDLRLPDDLLTSEDRGIKHETNLVDRDDEHQWIVDEARKNLEKNQERRVNEYEKGKLGRSDPYEEGDIVRYKLNEDTRNRLGGKISQRYSEPYVVTEVKENGYTYVLRPVDQNSRGREKVRHFNLLKTVSETVNEEPSLSKDERLVMENKEELDDTPSRTEGETLIGEEEPPRVEVRRSTRERKQVKRLQVDGGKKIYSEEHENLNEHSDMGEETVDFYN